MIRSEIQEIRAKLPLQKFSIRIMDENTVQMTLGLWQDPTSMLKTFLSILVFEHKEQKAPKSTTPHFTLKKPDVIHNIGGYSNMFKINLYLILVIVLSSFTTVQTSFAECVDCRAEKELQEFFDYFSTYDDNPEEARKYQLNLPTQIFANKFDTNNFCAIDNDSRVKCWGDRGLAYYENFKNPRQISEGDFFNCILDDEGVKCNSRYRQRRFRLISNLQNPRKISAGKYFVCALDDEGVKCWGGDSTFASCLGCLDGIYNPPSNLKNPIDIASGNSSACVLDDEGVKCWGYSGRGAANPPSDLKNPREISSGGDFVCALDDEGVKCWGNWEYRKTTPPNDLKNPRQLSSGRFASCVIDDDGVKCWGLLPYSDSSQSDGGLKNPRQVAVSGLHACVLDDERVKCWGRIYPSYTRQSRPSPYLQNPLQVVHTQEYDSGSCVLDTNGFRCWGAGVRFPGFDLPDNPSQLMGSSSHYCVLDGERVRCAGRNFSRSNPGPISPGEKLTNPFLIGTYKRPPKYSGYGDTIRACAFDYEGLKCWYRHAFTSVTSITKFLSLSYEFNQRNLRPKVVTTFLNNSSLGFDRDFGRAFISRSPALEKYQKIYNCSAWQVYASESSILNLKNKLKNNPRGSLARECAGGSSKPAPVKDLVFGLIEGLRSGLEQYSNDDMREKAVLLIDALQDTSDQAPINRKLRSRLNRFVESEIKKNKHLNTRYRSMIAMVKDL